MSDKKSFVMYESWGAAIEKMSNEQAGELIKAIYAYQKDPDAVPEAPALAFVFELIKQQLDADSQRYKEACAARSEAGKKGGRPKANVSDKKQMVSDESKKSKCFSEKAKKADNDNEYDNDLKKENTIDGVKEKRFAPPTLENVSEYCREMGRRSRQEEPLSQPGRTCLRLRCDGVGDGGCSITGWGWKRCGTWYGMKGVRGR